MTTTTKITTTIKPTTPTTEITIKTTEELTTTTTETTKTTTTGTINSPIQIIKNSTREINTNGLFTRDTEAYLANKKGKLKKSFCFVISNLKYLLCSF